MFQMDITMIFGKLYCIGLVAVFGQIPALIIAIAFMDYAMTNIQNFHLIKIWNFMPESKTYKDYRCNRCDILRYKKLF